VRWFALSLVSVITLACARSSSAPQGAARTRAAGTPAAGPGAAPTPAAGPGAAPTPAAEPARDVADPESRKDRHPRRPAGDMGEILDRHNQVRDRHCAPSLAWSEDLARTAQKWADRLARGCKLEHSGGKLGENLAAGTDSIMGPDHTVDMWYSEVGQYDFGRGGFSMETGHFTQLVWVGSSRLGCGVSACKGMRIWVCNYDPPGNVQGQYRDNVRRSSCR
jgi:uncharacterized protein YkwD